MTIAWEQIYSKTTQGNAYGVVLRAKVPGGWLVSLNVGNNPSTFFYPDPQHKWDGNSLP